MLEEAANFSAATIKRAAEAGRRNLVDHYIQSPSQPDFDIDPSESNPLMSQDSFIPLLRTFRELRGPHREDATIEQFTEHGEPIDWDSLLKERRVVLLAEAGAGKTEEIRRKALGLQACGQHAFFLRLELVWEGLEFAFEVGTHREFEAWISSTEDAWLFLDSVDESKLRSPADFMRAVKKLGITISAALPRAQIVITGRPSAWAPYSDLRTCNTVLPLEHGDSLKSGFGPDVEGAGPDIEVELNRAYPFKVYSLEALNRSEVTTFVTHRGVRDVDEFVGAIREAQAWADTARPQDLDELINYWLEHGRIGTPLERMKSSVERRLVERAETLAQAKPLSKERAREASRTLAAACTLAHVQTIGVPDGDRSTAGLLMRDVLADWSASDCNTLLSRPVFDPAIYGTVRFYHRTRREYLAAEWFHELLLKDSSRKSVEQVFFNKQFGVEVLVPTLRPVLQWLVHFDARLRARVVRVAPELFLEGGDPARLPVDTREAVLEAVCAETAARRFKHSATDQLALERFSTIELTSCVKRLIAKYQPDEDVMSFLVSVARYGHMEGALPECLHVAQDSRVGTSGRVDALQTAVSLGAGDEDLASIRAGLLLAGPGLSRRLVSGFLHYSSPDLTVADWLFECIPLLGPTEGLRAASLGDTVDSFIERLELSLLPAVLERLEPLLRAEPLVEREGCEVSVQNLWLLNAAALAVKRLAQSRDVGALNEPSLYVLRVLPMAQHVHMVGVEYSELPLEEDVKSWADLKWALFWSCVRVYRARMGEDEATKKTDYWRVMPYECYVDFNASDFDEAVNAVLSRGLYDDRQLALSVALPLYVQAGRQRGHLARLKKATQDSAELQAQLQTFLHPPKPTPRYLDARRRHASRKRRIEKEEQKRAKDAQEWLDYIRSNVELIRSPGDAFPTAVLNAHIFLFDDMRAASKGGSLFKEGLAGIAEQCGQGVAKAFRESMMSQWRLHKPVLLSEGGAENRLSYATMLGSTGIGFEALEKSGWPAQLNEPEAELAVRYACHELNGFPDWLEALHARFPGVVERALLQEVEYELAKEDETSNPTHYALAAIATTGPWLWNPLAVEFVHILLTRESIGDHCLDRMLNCVLGSSTPDAAVSALASANLARPTTTERRAIWLAVWLGVEPSAAFDRLVFEVGAIDGTEEKTRFMMMVLVNLVGGRRGISKGRHAYRMPKHLKDLYLFSNQHVRRSDDINRNGGGVYSPELRDDAQDARGALAGWLNELPGKEAYLALEEISRVHPDDASKPWYQYRAKVKAEECAESAPWTVKQVLDFEKSQTRTPKNHHELFELAVQVFDDFKEQLEQGDYSEAAVLQAIDRETVMRNYIGGWCERTSHGRYHLPQEEELADAKRPDLRWFGSGFTSHVPVELKLAENWSGPELAERLENQLCGDYMRESGSTRGIFLLTYKGKDGKTSWELPLGTVGSFDELVSGLQHQWQSISHKYPKVDEIRVIGIDLTKRFLS